MKQLKTLLFALVVMLAVAPAWACTTAVISGKFTASGRPMIWKVRDTEAYENVMKSYQGDRWSYVGLINTADAKGEQIWGGWNAVGFAIMNSASFNVNEGYTGKFIDREGYFMQDALRECRTLKDFEEFLKKRPRPMGVAAHFGVIDAEGGAAFYEVNNETWTKFDANNPEQAPRGYVLRTNYSFTGTAGKGLGFVRFQNAMDIFNEVPVGSLTPAMVMQQFSRCTYHSVLKMDYRKVYSKLPEQGAMISTDDLICRYGTSSAIAVEGINAARGERPEQTTGWVQVGLPYASMTMPMWCDVPLPCGLVAANPGEEAPLARKAMELKKMLYPMWKQSDGYHYIAIDKMFNQAGTGLTQRIEKEEDVIFRKTEEARKYWGKSKGWGKKKEYMPAELVRSINERAEKFYEVL